MKKDFLFSAAESNPPGSPPAPGQPNGPVDIDELEVTVLIICKSPNNFQQTANFLTRRGWPTTVVGNLSKAIEFVVKNSPDFILISCNHPNPNTARLPSLLSQAMNSQIVGFAEQSDASSNARLQNMSFKHKLQGLASGPNLQRFIRKILIELYNPTTPSSADGQSEGQDQQSGGIKPPNFKGGDSTSIEISGGSRSGSDSTVVASNSSKSNRTQMVRGGEPGSADGQGGPGTSGGPALIKGEGSSGGAKAGAGMFPMGGNSQSSAGNAGSGGLFGLGNQQANPSGQIRGISSSLSEKGDGSEPDSDEEGVENGSYRLSRKKDRKRLKDLMPQQTSASENGNESSAEAEANRQALMALMNSEKENKASESEIDSDSIVGAASSKGGLAGLAATNSAESTKSAEGSSEASRASKSDRVSNDTLGGGSFMARAAAKAAAAQKRPHAPPVAFRKAQPDPSAQTEKQDLLMKAIEDAMTKVCDPNHQEPRKLDEPSVLGVLCVDSDGLHGYLVVCATLFGPQDHILFLREFRETLLAGLMELGVQTNIEEPFSIATESFEFKAWAETTKFTYIGEHQGSELTVSFVPTEDRLPAVKSAETRDMARIQLDLIDPDQPVSFGTYLHLKRNNKYFLYLRHGRKLMANQKDRLKEKQVKELFIKSKDISNYRSYSAASYIQKSTRRFRRRSA